MNLIGTGAWLLRNRNIVGAAVAAVAIVAALLWVRADLIQTGAERATTEARKQNDAAIDAGRKARHDAIRDFNAGGVRDDPFRRD